MDFNGWSSNVIEYLSWIVRMGRDCFARQKFVDREIIRESCQNVEFMKWQIKIVMKRL